MLILIIYAASWVMVFYGIAIVTFSPTTPLRVWLWTAFLATIWPILFFAFGPRAILSWWKESRKK